MTESNKTSFSDIKEELKNSEYDRTFTHWTAEEDEKLIALHIQSKLSNLEIAQKHRRTVGSIKARLKLHGYPDKSPTDFAKQFENYLRHKINPITGEVLADDSAWLHPKIISDLEFYTQTVGKEEKKQVFGTSSSEPEIHEKERFVFHELFEQIEIFLPNITVRDAELLKFLYSNSQKKVTLQQTADQFQISRERVRQIRDRALKKLKLSLRHKKYLVRYDKARNVNTLSKRDALEYLNNVLDIFHSGPDLNLIEDATEAENEKINDTQNVGKAWTEEEVETLVSMWNAQRSIAEIATKLGRLNGGVRSRLRKLGLFNAVTEPLEPPPQSQGQERVWENDLDTASKQKIENEIEGMDIFRIEQKSSFTPYSEKNKISRSSFTDDEIYERRIKNYNSGRLINYFFPITLEEVLEMKKRFKEGKTIEELENYFQRSHKSILASLENEGFVVPAASEDEIRLIIKLFQEGQSIETISKNFDRTTRGIGLIVEQNR